MVWLEFWDAQYKTPLEVVYTEQKCRRNQVVPQLFKFACHPPCKKHEVSVTSALQSEPRFE